ncbi:Hypothetical protein DAL_137 [Psychrobacter phage D'Alembert]|nr:Hypothetical protein DAL_137 [Psychrobacter phage D'Alembert]
MKGFNKDLLIPQRKNFLDHLETQPEYIPHRTFNHAVVVKSSPNKKYNGLKLFLGYSGYYLEEDNGVTHGIFKSYAKRLRKLGYELEKPLDLTFYYKKHGEWFGLTTDILEFT